MKRIVTLLTLLFFSFCFSQSVNSYKSFVIPLKFDFQNVENQYRLQTLIKLNLSSAGFKAYYSNEVIPQELNERCKLLTVDLLTENNFLVTKLSVVLKDCYGVEIFKSEQGKSREKDFEKSYIEALTNAFKSIFALEYKYNENAESSTPLPVVAPSPITPSKLETKVEVQNNSETILFAQPTSYGFQLIDSQPKVIMKIFKTSNPASFMATKGSSQGVLISKENQWFFEYYQNDQLISELVNVKF